MIDGLKFFAEVRRQFGPLTQDQVDGYNLLLSVWEAKFWERTSVPQMAVVLATTYHETAHTMQPIAERGNTEYFTRLYDIAGSNPDRARRHGNTERGDGVRYRGRGFVQLTWKENYARATNRLRELGLMRPEIDFVKFPDQAMQPALAVLILFIGMEEGWFTGRKLDSIVDDKIDGDEFKDFVESRKIINGTDRDDEIAGIAMKFLSALMASVTPGTNKAPVVVSTTEGVVVEDPRVGNVPGASRWNEFWTSVAELFGGKKA